MAMGLLLVGCGTPKDASYGLNPQEPVAITVWHYYNGSQKVAFDNLVEEFNETTGKELGIVVEATSKGGVNDLIQAVTDSAEGKVGAAEMPNIFSAYSDTARKIDQMGLLASLEGYFSQEELDQYCPRLLGGWLYRRHRQPQTLPRGKIHRNFDGQQDRLGYLLPGHRCQPGRPLHLGGTVPNGGPIL